MLYSIHCEYYPAAKTSTLATLGADRLAYRADLQYGIIGVYIERDGVERDYRESTYIERERECVCV